MAQVYKSVYKRGADDGFYFGIYLSVMFFATAFSITVPFAGLLSFCMMIGVPFLIYRFLRRSYVGDYGTTTFSALWLQGIMTFLCGSLISGVVAYVFMRWVQPDYLLSTVQEVIKIYNDMDWPQGKEMADVLTKIVEQNMLPTPIQIVVEFIWFAVFSGSMLSIIVSLIVQMKKVKAK